MRTTVVDPVGLQRHAEELRASRSGLSGEALRENLRLSGTAARMLGDLTAAEVELTAALELSGDDRQTRTLALLRLAEVFRVGGDRDRAGALFADCVSAAGDLDAAAAAVIHQHAGKFAFDAADLPVALRRFKIAHRLRERSGLPDLGSSRHAMDVTCARLDRSS